MSARIGLRNSVARLLHAAGLTAPGRRGRERLSIVTFHRVLPEAERQAYPHPGLAVTPQELDAFLTYFNEYFDCGALATQHERHLRRERTARPLLALTFDDGQYDNFRNARPVLAKHGLLASFFVPVAAVERRELLWHDRLGFSILALLSQAQGGEDRLKRILADAGLPYGGSRGILRSAVQESKRIGTQARLRLVEELDHACGHAAAPGFARLMTFDELSELALEGHEIGSHSMTHCMMPECDDRALAYELVESRRTLQQRLGRSIDSFCYPNGDSDARTAGAVAKAGYRRAVTTTWGSNGSDEDAFRLRRCDMGARHVQDSNGDFVPAMVALRMSGFYPGLH